VHPFLLFTKLGMNPRRIGDRLVWAVRSNDLTHWVTRAPKNSKYILWFTLLDIFVISLGIKNGKQLMKHNAQIIANWVLKLEIKMSRCCIILKKYVKNFTSNDESKYR
jgi:hypothetical protein